MLNKVTESVRSILEPAVEASGLPLIGTVPEDENIRAFDLIGKPLIDLPEDSKAVVAVKGIYEKIVHLP